MSWIKIKRGINMNFLKRLGAAAAGLGLAVATTAFYVHVAPFLLIGLAVAAGLSVSAMNAKPLAAYATIVASPYILADKLLGYAATGKFESLLIHAKEKVLDKNDIPMNNITPVTRRP